VGRFASGGGGVVLVSMVAGLVGVHHGAGVAGHDAERHHRRGNCGQEGPVERSACHGAHHGTAVEDLAGVAAVSRAVFAQRFTRTVRSTPMQYLLQWRVALAKDLLDRERPPVAQLARRVGYQSATAFATAFTRVVGCSPSEYGRRT